MKIKLLTIAACVFLTACTPKPSASYAGCKTIPCSGVGDGSLIKTVSYDSYSTRLYNQNDRFPRKILDKPKFRF